MTLSEKDKVTLTYLLKLERRIRDAYKSLSKTCDFKGLIGLVDMEADLIRELNLDDKKLHQIERFLAYKANIQLGTKLLIGTSPYLDLNNYPFYRLIARAKYLLDERTDIETAFLAPRFKDVEENLVPSIRKISAKKYLQE